MSHDQKLNALLRDLSVALEFVEAVRDHVLERGSPLHQQVKYTCDQIDMAIKMAKDPVEWRKR